MAISNTNIKIAFVCVSLQNPKCHTVSQPAYIAAIFGCHEIFLSVLRYRNSVGMIKLTSRDTIFIVTGIFKHKFLISLFANFGKSYKYFIRHMVTS